MRRATRRRHSRRCVSRSTRRCGWWRPGEPRCARRASRRSAGQRLRSEMCYEGRMRSRLPLVVLVGAALAACGRQELTRPNLPQVQHGIETGRGDRYAAYRACVQAAPELEPLLACMKEVGYVFIARVPEYPHIECWQLRDRDGSELPPVYCWERAGGES